MNITNRIWDNVNDFNTIVDTIIYDNAGGGGGYEQREVVHKPYFKR